MAGRKVRVAVRNDVEAAVRMAILVDANIHQGGQVGELVADGSEVPVAEMWQRGGKEIEVVGEWWFRSFSEEVNLAYDGAVWRCADGEFSLTYGI